MTLEDWERLLVSEGLGAIGDSSYTASRRGPVEYVEWMHGGGTSLGEVMLLDKEDDDPVLVEARREIDEIASRLPPRWSVMLQLRGRGLTQRAIAARLGVRQPTIAAQLQRILRVLPSLLETRPVTEEEISEFVELSFPTTGVDRHIVSRRKIANAKREKLVSSYLRCWCKSHAAWEAGIPQCDAHKTLTGASSRMMSHPVSQVLVVLNSTLYYPDRDSLRGRGKGDRVQPKDFMKFL